MTISSNCKKLMAAVLAVALVLSVLFVPKAPKAEAAEGDPTVSVLGATIRLATGDNNGNIC